MFEEVTYESLLEEKLNMIPSTLDVRQGSILYNALAPNSAELAIFYLNLALSEDRFFADTATGEDLDRRCRERGVHRKKASAAIRLGIFKDNNNDFIDIELASRFRGGEHIYSVSEKISIGNYKITCETLGSIGNDYLGELIPIENIQSLAFAEIQDILIPGENEEDDETLRKKYYDSLDSQAFGGNIADYKQKTKNIAGVGGVKVTPVWNGGGTVKLTILDSSFSIPSKTLLETVQNLIDPVGHSGEGVGIAPIGHKVTVIGVSEEKIRINSKITIKAGYSFESLKSEIETALNKYFTELSATWEENEFIIVRISQIETKILAINGVEDIWNTCINGSAKNLELGKEQIPVLEVVINE